MLLGRLQSSKPRRETSDYVAFIQSQTCVNKKLAADILQVMMADGTHPTYADTKGSKNMLYIDLLYRE